MVKLRVNCNKTRKRCPCTGVTRGARFPGRRFTVWSRNDCRGRRIVPTMSQYFLHYSEDYFQNTSGSNMGAPNLLFAPGAIQPRYALRPGTKINVIPPNTHVPSTKWEPTVQIILLDITFREVPIDGGTFSKVVRARAWLAKAVITKHGLILMYRNQWRHGFNNVREWEVLHPLTRTKREPSWNIPR